MAPQSPPDLRTGECGEWDRDLAHGFQLAIRSDLGAHALRRAGNTPLYHQALTVEQQEAVNTLSGRYDLLGSYTA